MKETHARANSRTAAYLCRILQRGVYASANPGERYIVTLPEIEGEENRSFVVAYDNEGSNNGLLDVAFRENVFYTARFWKDNDDTYVSAGSFNHIRCDHGQRCYGSAERRVLVRKKWSRSLTALRTRPMGSGGFQRFYTGFPHESYVP